MKRSTKKFVQLNRREMFHFHPYRRKLLQRGFNCRLEDQPARVLAHMMARDGEEIGRSELIKLLWPSERYGNFSHRLDKVISKLRAALYDDPCDPLFIETLRGQGFRFIGASRIQYVRDDTETAHPRSPIDAPLEAHESLIETTR